MGGFLLVVFPSSFGAPLLFFIYHSYSLVVKVMFFTASFVSQVLLSHTRRKLNQFDNAMLATAIFFEGVYVGVCVCVLVFSSRFF